MSESAVRVRVRSSGTERRQGAKRYSIAGRERRIIVISETWPWQAHRHREVHEPRAQGGHGGARVGGGHGYKRERDTGRRPTDPRIRKRERSSLEGQRDCWDQRCRTGRVQPPCEQGSGHASNEIQASASSGVRPVCTWSDGAHTVLQGTDREARTGVLRQLEAPARDTPVSGTTRDSQPARRTWDRDMLADDGEGVTRRRLLVNRH